MFLSSIATTSRVQRYSVERISFELPEHVSPASIARARKERIYIRIESAREKNVFTFEFKARAKKTLTTRVNQMTKVSRVTLTDSTNNHQKRFLR